jgi:hypothetical protein
MEDSDKNYIMKINAESCYTHTTHIDTHTCNFLLDHLLINYTGVQI